MVTKSALFTFALVWLSSVAAADPGDLNTAFAGTGIYTGSDDGYQVRDGAMQADDRFVYVGRTGFNVGGDWVLVGRINSDGTPDTTFGTDGSGTVTLLGNYQQSGSDYGNAVAIDRTGGANDGKIYVVGYAFNSKGNADYFTARLNADGSLDSSFGSGGVVQVNLGGGKATVDVASAVTLQADGKVIVSGTISEATGRSWVTIRYSTAGAEDWRNKTKVANSTTSDVRDVAVDASGKILVAGTGDAGTTPAGWVFVRLNSNGTLDKTFDGDGKRYLSLGLQSEYVWSVIPLPNGQILACGTTTPSDEEGDSMTIARMNSDGSLDTSFGSNGGWTSSHIVGYDSAHDCALEPGTGNIVVSGFIQNAVDVSSLDGVLMRFTPAGAIDTGFGTDGLSERNTDHPIPGWSWTWRGLGFDSQGNAYRAGSRYDNRGTSQLPRVQITSWLME